MSARHAFACVFATALIAVAAALLHPLLGVGPLQGFDAQAGQAPPGGTASVTHRR